MTGHYYNDEVLNFKKTKVNNVRVVDITISNPSKYFVEYQFFLMKDDYSDPLFLEDIIS